MGHHPPDGVCRFHRIELLESGCHRPGTTFPSSTLLSGGAAKGLSSGQWTVGRVRSDHMVFCSLFTICTLDIDAQWISVPIGYQCLVISDLGSHMGS